MSDKQPKNQKQKQALVRIVIMGLILVCINVLASYFHKGLDLTQEKRFTLTQPTVNLLKNLQENVVVDVYLEDDNFPADIQRLKEAVREQLMAFKDIAGARFSFRFSNPFKGKNDAEKKQVAHELQQKGIQTMELHSGDEDEQSQRIFFPYALVQYNSREMVLMLLENKSGSTSPAENVNYAISLLEYKFANALNVMGKPDIAHIAYLVGNGEPLDITTVDMLSCLQRRYYVDTIDLSKVSQILSSYDAAIIVQPNQPFTEPEKLRIDQYLMKGGHLLLSLNALNASVDSLGHQSQFIAMENELNLDNLLFKYGIRVNKDLVEDKMNLKLPRTMNNGEPQMHDWLFFPKLNPKADHPIVKNLDFIAAQFTNSIDTIQTPDLKKTILLQTSAKSLKADAPVRVSLSMMNFKLEDQMFTKSYLPVAVLVEGKFTSAYNHILAPEYLHFLADSLKQPFKAKCDTANSIIVTSIGDAFTNRYSASNGIQPMGFYFYSREYFANRNFFLNCVEYLTDHSGVLEARSKDSKLRLLDMSRARDEKTKWQFVNVGIPVALVLVFSSAYFFFRKRRYEIRPDSTKLVSEHA